MEVGEREEDEKGFIELVPSTTYMSTQVRDGAPLCSKNAVWQVLLALLILHCCVCDVCAVEPAQVGKAQVGKWQIFSLPRVRVFWCFYPTVSLKLFLPKHFSNSH